MVYNLNWIQKLIQLHYLRALLFRLILIKDFFDFQKNCVLKLETMFGYEIESSGLVKTQLTKKNDIMIDLKCGPPSISVVPSHMVVQGNLPKIGSGMDFSYIWTKQFLFDKFSPSCNLLLTHQKQLQHVSDDLTRCFFFVRK